MADTREVEWQFDAVDLRPVLRWLAQAGTNLPASRAAGATDRDPPPVEIRDEGAANQVDVYLDTDDWRFHRAGYTLRLRRWGRRRAEATLKQLDDGRGFPARTPAGAMHDRREVTEPVDSVDPEAVRVAPGPVGERVRAVAGRRPLRTLFEVRTRRRVFSVERAGEPAGEIDLDDTTVPGDDGEAPARLRRVEVEVPEDTADALSTFVEDMRASCGLQPGTLTKFSLGMLSRGLAVDPEPEFGPTHIGPDLSFGELAFAVLRRQFSAFTSREPGTRLGDDPEDLHDMRVATRRLRAAISLFEGCLPVRIARLSGELRWIGGALGAVRDLDVQLQQLGQWVHHLPEPDREQLGSLRALLEGQRTLARRELLDALDSPRYARFVASFGRALVAGPLRRSPSSRMPVLAAAPGLVEERLRKVRKAGRRIVPGSAATDYHRLRIRCKRLRYALEFLAGVYPGRTERLVRRLVSVQDLLGEHQDAEVAIDRLRSVVAQSGHDLPPPAVFAMGMVSERYARRVKRLRADFPRTYRRLRGKGWKELRRAIEGERPRPAPPDPRSRPEAAVVQPPAPAAADPA